MLVIKNNKIAVVEVDGVEGKSCTKCSLWKPLASFHKSKVGSGGVVSKCKACQREYVQNKKEYYSEYNRNHREANKDYYQAWRDKNREYFDNLRKTNPDYNSEWKKKNRTRVNLIGQRRRAKINDLPYSMDFKHQDGLDICVLTGSDDIHLDHVIPISIGHGGTVYGNIIPLRSDLNLSKGNSNIFKWFMTNGKRYEIPQVKFDALIEMLAEQNDMTVEEYRNYVYYCHENPAQ